RTNCSANLTAFRALSNPLRFNSKDFGARHLIRSFTRGNTVRLSLCLTSWPILTENSKNISSGGASSKRWTVHSGKTS
ncbi:uncharacterized protein METZ01_LOCUS456422, partial [marine metagenome]